MAVGREVKCLPSLSKELDEVAVVARGDVREAGMGGVDVSSDGSVEELTHGIFVIWQEFDAATFDIRWATNTRGC